MASSATPYGFRPVKRADGMPYSGAVSHYLIDPAGEAFNLYNGTIVALGADGYITLAAGTGADETTGNLGGSSIPALGVFVGCEYTNAQGQLVQSQYYPTGTANGGPIKAYVVDDPNVLFQVQLDGAGAQTIIGSNIHFTTGQVTGDGSTTTGNSTKALNVAQLQATTAAFKIVAHVSDPSDDYPDVLVKFNPAYHMMTSNLGTA